MLQRSLAPRSSYLLLSDILQYLDVKETLGTVCMCYEVQPCTHGGTKKKIAESSWSRCLLVLTLN